METAVEEACKMIVNYRKARAFYLKEKAIYIKLARAADEAEANKKEAFKELKKVHALWTADKPAPLIHKAALAAADAKLTEEADEEDVAIAIVEMKATAEHCVSCSVLPPKKRTRVSPITN
jgi:hypothetical protein